jgi:hypothetical protein
MQGSELSAIIEKFKTLQKHFLGVYSIDTLPNFSKLKTFCFCNTDVSDGAGKHWLCFVKSSKKVLECFDSLGVDNNKLQLLRDNCNFTNIYEIDYNETQFQESSSSTCGKFVIYFAIHRMHNLDLDFEEVLEEIFTLNHIENEKTVDDFVKDFLT